MRGKYLLIGLVIIIFATLSLFYGTYLIRSIEEKDVAGIPMTEFLKTISDDDNTHYQIGKILQIFGVIFLIIGRCLIVIGSVLQIKEITLIKIWINEILD